MKKILTFATFLLCLAGCKRDETVPPLLSRVPKATNTAAPLAAPGTLLLVAGKTSSSGFNDGIGAAARFNFISGIFVGGDGTLYICDSGNQAVRRISIQNRVTTLKIDPEFFGDLAFGNTPLYVAVLNNGTVGISANQKIVLYKDGAIIKSFNHFDISAGRFDGIDTDPKGTFFYFTHNYVNLQDNIIKGYLGMIKKSEISGPFKQIADQNTADELHTRANGLQYTLSDGGLYIIESTGISRVYANLITEVIRGLAINKAGTEIYLITGDSGDIKRIKNNQVSTIAVGTKASSIALANSEKYLYFGSRDYTVYRLQLPE